MHSLLLHAMPNAADASRKIIELDCSNFGLVQRLAMLGTLYCDIEIANGSKDIAPTFLLAH